MNNGVYEISTIDNLKDILGFSSLSANNFKLINNLDLSSISNFYIPILKSNFDGNSKIISNLNIKLNNQYLGFFGYSNNVKISNLGLENISIEGNERIGGLLGYSYNSIIESSYTTGSVRGTNYIGGLTGLCKGSIKNSYATASVNGELYIGGIIGSLEFDSNVNLFLEGENESLIKNSYATGSVSGTEAVGGLLGDSYKGSITNSYATGYVSGSNNVGGLLGHSYKGSITNSYATGSVSGTNYVGGLLGNGHEGSISNSYATGSVSGSDDLGGLAGYVDSETIKNSFWNKDTTGQITSEGSNDSYGKTTEELENISIFNSLDTPWEIEEDSSIKKGSPILSWQVGKSGVSKPLWLIGTNIEITPVIIKPEIEPKQEIEKIITSIVNKEAIKITLPKIQTTTPLNSGKNVNIAFLIGENKMIVSKPIEGQATTRISLSEAKQMQADTLGIDNVDEVRVSLSRSSIIQLVDGGVSLPDGIEQEFYIADKK